MKAVGNILIGCTLLMSLFLLDCTVPVAGGTDTGNAVIAGILYNPDGSRAVNAQVRAIPVDHNPISEIENRITAIDSTFTNDSGAYSFDSLPEGYYNIFGEGDSGLSFNDSFFVSKDTANIFPDDTLGSPGTLRGVVRLQPGNDSRTVIILMFGTKIWEAPADSIGNFSLANMAAGTYNVRFLSTLSNYNPLDMQLSIKAGVDSTMPDTIRLPYTGIPVPDGLKAYYDTLNGLVNLSWNALNFSKLEGYFVYRNDTSSTIPVIISGDKALKDTFYIDTIFTDPLDTNNFVYKYRLKSQDTNAIMSDKYSNHVEISAVSPTKVRTFLTLSSYNTFNDTASINDTVKIAVNFINETRKNTNIYWYVDTSDSAVKHVDIDTVSGTDTLEWTWDEVGTHWVYVKIQDVAGTMWEDSCAIYIIRDLPIVNAGNDTTVSINDTIALRGTAEDKYGEITGMWWDIDNTTTFIETKTGDTNVIAPDSAVANYECVFKAIDDDSNIVFDTVRIKVETDPPVAAIAPDSAKIGTEFTLSASQSSPGNFGSIIKYEWSIGSYTNFIECSKEDTIITAPSDETDSFLVVLRVTDDDDNADLDTHFITIYPFTHWEPVGMKGFAHGNCRNVTVVSDTNGNVYTAFIDEDIKKASVMKFNGIAWEYVGLAEFTDDNTILAYLAVSSNNVLHIAYSYSLGSNNKVTVMQFNGVSWEPVGQRGFTTIRVGKLAFVFDNNDVPYVAFPETNTSGKISVMKYSGGTWEYVGLQGFSDGVAADPAIAKNNNGEIYVAFADATARFDVTVMHFTNTAWELVGQKEFTGDTVVTKPSLTICNNNIPYISFKGFFYDRARVMRFNNGAWETVGDGFVSDGEATYTSISTDNKGIPFVAFDDDNDNKKVSVKRFIGSQWEYIVSKGISDGETQYVNLIINNSSEVYVGFMDIANAGITVMSLK